MAESSTAAAKDGTDGAAGDKALKAMFRRNFVGIKEPHLLTLAHGRRGTFGH